jgi:predicted alpha/beta-fold hydrolase
VNFRGCAGLKLTSPKIYWTCNWTDVKEPIEYIHARFCSGDNHDFMKRNLYAYAVSLGACMLTKYLIKSGDKCVLSGAIPYSVFYDGESNVTFFKSSGWKFYDFAMGHNYFKVLKRKEEEIRDLFGNEKYQEFISKV